MYKVTNLTTQEITYCDAIETIIYSEGNYIPSEEPDGFRALTIVHISDTEETYTEKVFVYEGHTLSGTEDIGKVEFEEGETDVLEEQESGE